MIDIDQLRATATKLDQWAQRIARDIEVAPYPTSDADIRLLGEGAKGLRDACQEIEDLRAAWIRCQRRYPKIVIERPSPISALRFLL